MRKLIMKISCLLMCFLLAACSGSNSNEESPSATPSDSVEVTEETVQETVNYPIIELTELSDILASESDLGKANVQYSKFASNLFKTSFKEDENGLISPYSLYAVLSILANGANNSDKADTKLLLENVLGMTTNDLNKFYSYTCSDLDIVNGLLFNTDFGIKMDDSLRSTIKKYYGDSIKEQSFSDVNQLVTDINKWSMIESNGSIPTIIDNTDVKNNTIMFLLNALSIEGLWNNTFDPNETVLQNFNNSDNTKVNVSMMKQTLDGYWQTDNAVGFVNDLKSGYTFVGILPDEGIKIGEYIKTLDENTIQDMINSYTRFTDVDEEKNEADYHYTNLSFPKLKYSVTNELDDVLKQLGLNSLYKDDTCDFSSFGDDKIYLQNVKQKTNVEANESRVEMSAITTGVGAFGATGFPAIRQEIYHDVIFDKPFIYALLKQNYDSNHNLNYIIMFMGVVNVLDNETEVNKIEKNGKSAVLYPIGIAVDSIKIRSTPTVKENNQIGLAVYGRVYFVYEIKENDGYTWYRISENAWIADDGTWTYRADQC